MGKPRINPNYRRMVLSATVQKELLDELDTIMGSVPATVSRSELVESLIRKGIYYRKREQELVDVSSSPESL